MNKEQKVPGEQDKLQDTGSISFGVVSELASVSSSLLGPDRWLGVPG